MRDGHAGIITLQDTHGHSDYPHFPNDGWNPRDQLWYRPPSSRDWVFDASALV
ncbi:hypothetical protein OEM_25080 [Mycobacterium intracellulare subsp. yongonense 05-1390]|uniref:hypothetical protein n=1 Tax=Mycobacterium TaxID=1763 RepID=UPI00035575F8|nr:MULTISPECIES: hypothetical protein [Mycobacterium]AGP64043.1 hypothetical protein OEM_25080 [Mycobacterium intracellulare subsp. yongonense 05-1390]ARR78170.1 hypothetical protein MOTT12_02506 [Mycobacterium intracellulare subsp. yongonense]ARR83261.1 hypothetical protein MOTT27_02440 [Mycobacterium intracellulare subsp. yongonense]KEF95855.1 hypothetical protein K883_04297 [Mycobacterium sp. TKK-01-0059]